MAGGAASSASSIANALQAAVNQNNAQKRMKDEEKAVQGREEDNAYYHALENGWQDVPMAQQQPQAAAPGRPTLQTPAQPGDTAAAPVPQAIDPSRIKQIGRRAMYKPTDQETGKAFVPAGQLGEALKTGGWDGKTPITPEQSHSIMQALDAAQPKDEPYEYDASGKYLDAATGKPVPGFIGKKTKKFYPVDMGQGGGTQASGTPGAAPGGVFDTSRPFDQTGQNDTAQVPSNGGAGVTFSPKEKDEKTKNLHFETHTNDKGDVTTFGYDPETMELKSTHVAKGVGPQRRDPIDPNAPKPPKPMSPGDARQIVQNKAKALADAQKAYTKESSEAITDDDHKAANDNLRKGQQQAQLNYEQELSAATGKEIPHNNWADGGATTPVRSVTATATPATPGKTQTPAKPAQPVAAPAAQPAAAAAATPRFATNKKTGERLELKGGKWVPTTAR